METAGALLPPVHSKQWRALTIDHLDLGWPCPHCIYSSMHKSNVQCLHISNMRNVLRVSIIRCRSWRGTLIVSRFWRSMHIPNSNTMFDDVSLIDTSRLGVPILWEVLLYAIAVLPNFNKVQLGIISSPSLNISNVIFFVFVWFPMPAQICLYYLPYKYGMLQYLYYNTYISCDTNHRFLTLAESNAVE